MDTSEEHDGEMGEFEAMLSIEAVGQVCPDTAEYLYNQHDSVEIEQHYTDMVDHIQTQFRMHDIVVPETHVLTRGKEGFKQQL